MSAPMVEVRMVVCLEKWGGDRRGWGSLPGLLLMFFPDLGPTW